MGFWSHYGMRCREVVTSNIFGFRGHGLVMFPFATAASKETRHQKDPMGQLSRFPQISRARFASSTRHLALGTQYTIRISIFNDAVPMYAHSTMAKAPAARLLSASIAMAAVNQNADPYKSTLQRDPQSLWPLVSRAFQRNPTTNDAGPSSASTEHHGHFKHIPPLPVGIHSAAVRAACPAHVFSPPANISWEVVDGRPTNTSIQGKRLTNERTPEFTLGANKGRCSFEYWLDDGPKAQQDSKGKAFEAKLLNPIPSWPHSKAILSFQSSAGLGTSYEIKVDGVKTTTPLKQTRLFWNSPI